MNNKERSRSTKSERSQRLIKTESKTAKSEMDQETRIKSNAQEKASWITRIDNFLIQPDLNKEAPHIKRSGKISNFWLQLRLGNAPEVEAIVQVNKIDKTNSDPTTQVYDRKIAYQGRVENGNIIQFIDDLGEYELPQSEIPTDEAVNPVMTHAFLSAWVGLMSVRRGVEDGGSVIATRLVNTNPDMTLTREVLTDMIFQNLNAKRNDNFVNS